LKDSRTFAKNKSSNNILDNVHAVLLLLANRNKRIKLPRSKSNCLDFIPDENVPSSNIRTNQRSDSWQQHTISSAAADKKSKANTYCTKSNATSTPRTGFAGFLDLPPRRG
jgi:hypothetical protein